MSNPGDLAVLRNAAPLRLEAVERGLRVFRWRGFVVEGRFVSRALPLHGVIAGNVDDAVRVRFEDGAVRTYAIDELHLLRITPTGAGENAAAADNL